MNAAASKAFSASTTAACRGGCEAAANSSAAIAASLSTVAKLNAQENVWQFMRGNWLSNRVFTSYDNLLDHRCAA